MAKVHFAPFCAIKYVGTKSKEFNTSLARPKPMLKKGDIVIVDKKSAFNLVNKGFGEFVNVDSIEFTKADKENANTENSLADEIETLRVENEKLKEELSIALLSLSETDVSVSDMPLLEDKEIDEAFGVVGGADVVQRELADELLNSLPQTQSE